MLYVSKKWREYFDINNEKRSSLCWRSCISTHTWMDERKLLDPNSSLYDADYMGPTDYSLKRQIYPNGIILNYLTKCNQPIST